MTALDLLQAYTDRHNAGLGGTWAETLPALFHPDARVVFVGLPQAPCQGLPAILAAFAAHPPGDAFSLVEAAGVADTAIARYAWNSDPSTAAGSLLLEAEEGRIALLAISGMPRWASADPLQTALTLARTRFAGCEAVLLAGSVVRGEATPSSDLDLVVLHPTLEQAQRESFIADGWPVEAFVHDPQTLDYFFWKVDRPSGRPSLPAMVDDAIALPASTPLTRHVRGAARRLLAGGPDPLTPGDLLHLRYALTDQLDDLRHARSPAELTATAAGLYDGLANFILRSHGCWGAGGKAIPRALDALSPALGRRFTAAFAAAFSAASPDGVLALAEEVLAPHGGPCFDGYRRQAPGSWRSAN